MRSSNILRNDSRSVGVSEMLLSGEIIGLTTPSYVNTAAQNAPRTRKNLIAPLSHPVRRPSQSFIRSERVTPRIVAQRGPRNG